MKNESGGIKKGGGNWCNESGGVEVLGVKWRRRKVRWKLGEGCELVSGKVRERNMEGR